MDLAGFADSCGVFCEPARVRALAVLCVHELSVAELQFVLELAQSRVSSHLARLKEAGLVRDRKVGTSTLWRYAEHTSGNGSTAQHVWEDLRPRLEEDAAMQADLQRAQAAVERRQGKQGALEAWAGELEKHYSPGRTWEALARALAGVSQLGDVVDLGGGDGAVAQMLAPHARHYTLVDHSEAMLAAARRRLGKLPHLRLEQQDLHALTLPHASADAVLLFNVLTDVEKPPVVLRNAAALLRPHGRLVVVTLGHHDHAQAMEQWRQRHAGFSPTTLGNMLRRAGLEVLSCAVTSKERRAPRFDVVTAFATPGGRAS